MGNNVLSKFEEENPTDIIAIENKEYLIGIQLADMSINWIYPYIRAPIGKNVELHAKKIKENKEETLKQNIITIKERNNKSINLYGLNKIITADNATINYYIKFLDLASYNTAINKENQKIDETYKFNVCLNGYKGFLPKENAAKICKNLYNLK